MSNENIVIDQTLPTVYEVSEQYLFMTVTNYFTGKISEITGNEIILSDSAWIPDVGRFYDALKSGEFKEVEPIPMKKCILNKSAIVSVIPWPHKLPDKQK